MPERWPDLAVLELLIAVAEHGSLSAAARAVDMAQPNATRAIARLERNYGIRVLDRKPRGSQLTAEGTIVAHWAQTVLDAATELRIATDALRVEHHAHLTVAASMTVAEHLMPAWLSELRKDDQKLAIELQVHNSRDIFTLVENDSCDIGFVESPDVPSTLKSTAIARDRLSLVVSTQHPWAHRTRPVSAAELARTSLVVRERGSGTRTTLDDALAAFDAVAPTLVLNSNAAVLVSVAAGAGPAVLSELAVASAVRAGTVALVATEGIDLVRTMRAVWKGGTVHGAAADLVRISRKVHH